MSATLEELRELSLRSRKAQRAGFLALLLALLLYPLQFLAASWVGTSIAAAGALVVGALPFLRYAYLAGEERGAFRRVFRRLAEERRTRTLTPEDVSARAPLATAKP